MRVHHLSCATMCPMGGRLVGANGGLLSRGQLVCHCLLIEGPHGLILVDTGFGTEDLLHARARLGVFFVASTGLRCDPSDTALAQLCALGFHPRDVRDIVVTHLDLDHAGGLADFPEARVHVHRAEHKAALRRATFLEKQRYKPVQWQHKPIWQLHEATGETWQGFASVRPLPGHTPGASGALDDVLLVPLHGHTRGHCGVAVRDDRGWLLHAGDAYFDARELDSDPPYCPPMLAFYQGFLATDNAARLSNQERLRALHREQPDLRIFCAHSADELDRLTAASQPAAS